MPLILLTLALAPVAAIIIFIYIKDKYDKEPKRLLAKAFFLGILSIIPAVIGGQLVGGFFDSDGGTQNPLVTAVYAFIVVALTEEFGKFIFLNGVLSKSKHFDEPFDGIIYGVMVGMGFAAFENILYVVDGGLGVALLRMFTAIPAHALFGIAMGYYVGLAKFDPKNKNKLLAQGLFSAVLLHGVYDFFLMQQVVPGLFILSFVSLILAWQWSKNAIKLHQMASPFIDTSNSIAEEENTLNSDV